MKSAPRSGKTGQEGYISPPTKGAIGELVASAHFLSEGWSVYRSESPSAPFDLVIYKQGVIKRVEVKIVNPLVNTGRQYPSSGNYYLPPLSNFEWDLLAAVVGSKVWVFPVEGFDRSEVSRVITNSMRG